MPRTSVRGVSAWAEGHEVEAVGRCLRDLGELGVGLGDSQADARCREWREQERQERKNPGENSTAGPAAPVRPLAQMQPGGGHPFPAQGCASDFRPPSVWEAGCLLQP